LKALRLFILLIITAAMILPVSNQAVPPALAQSSPKREVSIPVKVVFVGIDPSTVDTSYIRFDANLPSTSYEVVYYPQPNLTGVVYNVNYSFTFASDSYKSKLVSYLKSIEREKTARNPWFFTYVAEPDGYVSTRFFRSTYAAYDANQVEFWIYSNQQELGGFPSDGWTIMLLNFTELPSYDFKDWKDFIGSYRQAPPNGTAHYYSVEYGDSDLGYQLRYRDFMTAWGGVNRFWFYDLSAGPSFQNYPEDIPIQIALKDNNIDLHSSYGRSWFTEYVSDYIYQATVNLVTPWFLYPPLYSEKYSFHVHVFDNRTSSEKSQVDIRSTIDADKVKQAFEDLIPYSKINVTVDIQDLAKYPDLQNVIDSNYKYADSYTMGVEFASPQQFRMVDARPVYEYLQGNMQIFEPDYHRDRSEFTVPVYAFAFSNETYFAWSYKWIVEPFGGIALNDIALVGASQYDFTRGEYISPSQPGKGLGFTHDVIHEAGHNLGLTHPHDPGGPAGDFSLSVMGYFTYDYVFGIRDKDALRRGHVDEIYLEVLSMLQQISGSSADNVRNQLKEVDAKYSQMDYVGALASVLKAEEMAKSAITAGPGLAVESMQYVILGVAAGLVLGFVAAWIILKRRHPSQQTTV